MNGRIHKIKFKGSNEEFEIYDKSVEEIGILNDIEKLANEDLSSIISDITDLLGVLPNV